MVALLEELQEGRRVGLGEVLLHDLVDCHSCSSALRFVKASVAVSPTTAIRWMVVISRMAHAKRMPAKRRSLATRFLRSCSGTKPTG